MMEQSPLQATVDYSRPGKQHGHLRVPYSYNLAGWANLLIPITVIQNGRGPTALVSGGNHGDEYPGQIAIMKLCREIEPAQVQGRLILLPSLNYPACKVSQRLSPLDGKNMNRAFPGNPVGTMTDMIADYLTRVLFPLADLVVDIHTGGRSMDFVPCTSLHLVDDPHQRAAMVAGTAAWNAPFSLFYTDIAGTGLLPGEAERQGKFVITCEMGGTECVSPAIHQLTISGLRNVLAYFKILQEPVHSRADLGLPPTQWLQALGRENYLFAPESGLWENIVPLGSQVRQGEPLGRLHFLERPDREPLVIPAECDGVLIAVRSPVLTSQGDCVASVAYEASPELLLNPAAGAP